MHEEASLGIEKILVREMSDRERTGTDAATARREKYFIPYTCMTPGFSTYETMSCDGDMMKKIENVCESKAVLLKRINDSVQTINVVANGLRPDLFQIIAESMK